MIELDGPIRPYAWGSRTFLAELQGRDAPAPTPEAELWLGAHPDAPAHANGTPLTDVIATDPRGVLGDAVVARFGERLPYLLKLLAADAPLSIQVHPDAEQAREGFARQGSEGQGPEAVRTYADPYPKPELLVAITPFEALCGFRHPDHTADHLAGLGVSALDPVVAALRDRSAPIAARLRSALTRLLEWPPEERAALVDGVVAAGEPLAVRLAQQYPNDVGVVVALLLNHVRLRPGEAIFMPAGNVHAYLGGAGVEIMGASDNVLRAGLTAKHVDPVELMRIVRYEVLADPTFPGTPLGPGLTSWAPPVSEFRLVRAVPEPADALTLPGGGPRIVTCVRGRARLRSGSSERELPAGRAVFVAAAEPPVEVSGETEVYQASPGR
ncbi:MAG: mannose-6-phosphate isomerase, class I [Micromonosporaceae bacterium]|nr:mannose-6-phosphate isomerase, class I [Micromonosporaceae bacterium]